MCCACAAASDWELYVRPPPPPRQLFPVIPLYRCSAASCAWPLWGCFRPLAAAHVFGGRWTVLGVILCSSRSLARAPCLRSRSCAPIFETQYWRKWRRHYSSSAAAPYALWHIQARGGNPTTVEISLGNTPRSRWWQHSQFAATWRFFSIYICFL